MGRSVTSSLLRLEETSLLAFQNPYLPSCAQDLGMDPVDVIRKESLPRLSANTRCPYFFSILLIRSTASESIFSSLSKNS